MKLVPLIVALAAAFWPTIAARASVLDDMINSLRKSTPPAPAETPRVYQLKGVNGQLANVTVIDVRENGLYGFTQAKPEPSLIAWGQLDMQWLEKNQHELWIRTLRVRAPTDAFHATATASGPRAELAAGLRTPLSIPAGTTEGWRFVSNGNSYELPQPKELVIPGSSPPKTTQWLLLDGASKNSASYRFLFHFPELTSSLPAKLKLALAGLKDDTSNPLNNALKKCLEAVSAARQNPEPVRAEYQRAFAALLREIERQEKAEEKATKK